MSLSWIQPNGDHEQENRAGRRNGVEHHQLRTRHRESIEESDPPIVGVSTDRSAIETEFSRFLTVALSQATKLAR